MCNPQTFPRMYSLYNGCRWAADQRKFTHALTTVDGGFLGGSGEDALEIVGDFPTAEIGVEPRSRSRCAVKAPLRGPPSTFRLVRALASPDLTSFSPAEGEELCCHCQNGRNRTSRTQGAGNCCSVFRKTVTRPLPLGAEFITRKGVRLTRWRDGKGKIRTAPVTTERDGTERIREESSTYFARHRDGNGVVVETPIGCRDESAARQMLADLERRAERVRSGLLTSAEARIAEHLTTPIGEHVAAYLESMKSRGVVEMHRANTPRHLGCLIRECGFERLADLKREGLERWLSSESTKGRSARSRNAHHTALVSFCNWSLAVGRLSTNPFKGVPKAN